MFRWILIILPLLLTWSAGHAQTLPLPANCASGTLVTLTSPNNLSVCGTSQSVGTATTTVYRGIPYATAARWQNPVAISNPATATVLAATQFGPACPQPGQFGLQQSEDCLYLNIWVPPGATSSSNLPVMVFFYGGAFVSGAGSLPLYDGASLAASGNVIVVTLNYRLGALGFIYAPNLTFGVSQSNPQGSSVQFGGNFGLFDQQSALNWVQTNISGFGGNAKNVTIFGESAGAMSVALHLMAIPTSNGTVNGVKYSLFQKAIMESNPMGLPYSTTPNATAYLNTLCTVLNPNNGGNQNCWTNAANLSSFANSVSLDQVMQAQNSYATGFAQLASALAGGWSKYLPFAPVYDGPTNKNQPLITGQPMSGYANTMNPLPTLFGTNLNEGALFGGLAFSNEPGFVTSGYSGNGNMGMYGALLDALYGTNAGQIPDLPSGAYNAAVQSATAPSYYNVACYQNAAGTTICDTAASTATPPCPQNDNPVVCFGAKGTNIFMPSGCSTDSSDSTSYSCSFAAPTTTTNGCQPPFNNVPTTCTINKLAALTKCVLDASNVTTCTFAASDCSPVSQACAVAGNGAPVALANVITDDIFTCGNLKGASAMLNAKPSAPTLYAYQFTQPPLFNVFPGVPACSEDSGNVCHASELPYVFNTLNLAVYDVPVANATLASGMGTFWTNFATYGNPNGKSGATWPAYSSTSPNVYVLNASGNSVTTTLATTANCTTLWNRFAPLSKY